MALNVQRNTKDEVSRQQSYEISQIQKSLNNYVQTLYCKIKQQLKTVIQFQIHIDKQNKCFEINVRFYILKHFYYSFNYLFLLALGRPHTHVTTICNWTRHTNMTIQLSNWQTHLPKFVYICLSRLCYIRLHFVKLGQISLCILQITNCFKLIVAFYPYRKLSKFTDMTEKILQFFQSKITQIQLRLLMEHAL